MSINRIVDDHEVCAVEVKALQDEMKALRAERDALQAWKINAQITLDYDKVQLDALADVIEATKAALNAEEDTHEVPDVNEWADAYRVENALKFLSSYQEAVK